MKPGIRYTAGIVESTLTPTCAIHVADGVTVQPYECLTCGPKPGSLFLRPRRLCHWHSLRGLNQFCCPLKIPPGAVTVEATYTIYRSFR